MAKVQDGLSDTQAFALIFETTGTRNLLGLGIWSLRHARYRESTLDPVMTMLSIGVEKLMKMSLGLINVAERGAWPSHAQFKNVWRHDLSLMNAELLVALRGRLHLATHRSVVEPLLLGVESDPGWQPIVDALSRYGVSGRFYHLDQLAEQPQTGEQPEALWDEAERALIDHDAGMKASWNAASEAGGVQWDSFLHDLEARMARSVENFWTLLSVAGVHGMLGGRGNAWGADVAPDMVDGRQIRPH